MNTPQELTLCENCHGESPNHETWCPTVVEANTEGDDE